MAVDEFFLKYPPIIQKLMDEKQDGPNLKEISEYNNQYKQVLITNHVKLFGFMLYLIRRELGLNQTDMGIFLKNYSNNKHRIGLSKSGYSKIENGLTNLDFELVFILSDRLKVDFNIIYELYSKIIMLAVNNGCYLFNRCGYLGHGNNLEIHFNLIETSDEYWYTDLKNYFNYFKESDLEIISDQLAKVFVNKGEIKYILSFQRHMRESRLKRKRSKKTLNN